MDWLCTMRRAVRSLWPQRSPRAWRTRTRTRTQGAAPSSKPTCARRRVRALPSRVPGLLQRCEEVVKGGEVRWFEHLRHAGATAVAHVRYSTGTASPGRLRLRTPRRGRRLERPRPFRRPSAPLPAKKACFACMHPGRAPPHRRVAGHQGAPKAHAHGLLAQHLVLAGRDDELRRWEKAVTSKKKLF
jgi:hypothetical protein